MSILKLGKIDVNKRANNLTSYVAALIDSESGLLTPKIITDKWEIPTYYGDFSYEKQYESYIDNNLPVILIPTITKESRYNKCSLRLNRVGTSIPYTYPKLDKDYNYVKLSNWYYEDLTNEWIRTELRFFPEVVVVGRDNNGRLTAVEADVEYKVGNNGLTQIRVTIFEGDKKVTKYSKYKVFYESIGEIDNDPDCIEIIQPGGYEGYHYSGNNFSLTLEIDQPEDTELPEIVVTEKVGLNYNLIRSDISADDRYIHINLKEKEESISTEDTLDKIIRLDIRKIPKQYLRKSDLLNLLNSYDFLIDHEEPQVHNLKTELRLPPDGVFEERIPITADVIYSNSQFEVILTQKITERTNIICYYNFIRNQKDVDYYRELRGNLYYNIILDFTNTSNTYIRYYQRGDAYTSSNGDNYIFLNLSNGVYLLTTKSSLSNLPSDISSSDYTGIIQYTIDNNTSLYDLNPSYESEYRPKLNLIKGICDALENNSQDFPYILMDFIEEFIQNWCDRELYIIGKVEEGYNEYQTKLSNGAPYDRFIQDSYIEDYWLDTNYEIEEILESIISKFKYTVNDPSLDDNGVTYVGSQAFNRIWELSHSDDQITAGTFLGQGDRWERSVIFNIPVNKLFIKLTNSQVESYYYLFDGLNIYTSQNYTYDRLCEYTENDKLIEFYALPKGPVGQNITINIVKDDSLYGVYNITISNNIRTETYQCYLVNYNDYADGLIQFTEINRYSELVRVKLYSYKYNGQLIDYSEIDTDEYDKNNDLLNYENYDYDLGYPILINENGTEVQLINEYGEVIYNRLTTLDTGAPALDNSTGNQLVDDSGDLLYLKVTSKNTGQLAYNYLGQPLKDENNRQLYLELTTKGEAIYNSKSILLEQMALPEGTWYLDRVTEETYTFNDLKWTLLNFSDLDYYPDLILVDKIQSYLKGFKWEDYRELITQLVRADVVRQEFNFDYFIPSKSDISTYIPNGLYSQCLMNLRYEDLPASNKSDKFKPSAENKLGIPNDNANRLLFFFGDLTIDHVIYSSLYPYVMDMINSTYLHDIQFNLLYDIFELKEGNTCIISDKNDSKYAFDQLGMVDDSNEPIGPRFLSMITRADSKFIHCVSKDDKEYEFKIVEGNIVQNYYDILDLLRRSILSMAEGGISGIISIIMGGQFDFTEYKKIYPELYEFFLDESGNIDYGIYNYVMDINQDGEINITDVADIVTEILGNNTEVVVYDDTKYYLFPLIDYLNHYSINYLRYDNLHYYYETLNEVKGQSSIFIVRFLTSKISRQVLRNRHRLIGRTQGEFKDVLDSIFENYLNVSDLYNTLEYEFELSGNYLKLQINCSLKYLVNKKYKVNFELNIN